MQIHPTMTLILATVLLTSCSEGLKPCAPSRATLYWSRIDLAENVPDTTIQGYRVYYGRTSQTYENTVDVPVSEFTNPEVSTSIGGFEKGQYYFAVSAYNNVGEGPKSDEVPHSFSSCGQSFSLKTN